jgi:hypothetical protein
MNKLTDRVIFKSDFCETQCRQMYELYQKYYGGTNWSLFREDLTRKHCAILLLDRSQALRGFTTLEIIDFEWENQPRRALFSGDTIIDRPYWGEQTLPLAWCRLAGQIKAELPQLPLYWFLIVKGYRTYRYLPVFAKSFYPTWRSPTPDSMRALMDYLATLKFGDNYRRETGLVQFPESRGHLNGIWAEIKPGYRQKPDVRYFLERNPNYDCGDELVCLMELTEENMRSQAKRGFIEGIQSADPPLKTSAS